MRHERNRLAEEYAQRVALDATIARRDIEREQQRTRHADSKDAVLEFLQAVQAAEQSASSRYYDDDDRYLQRSDRINAVWFRQKAVDVCCSLSVRHAALEYANQLHQAVFGEEIGSQEPWKFVEKSRDKFLAAAREELSLSHPVTE
jgi:hypothetical protein